MASSKLRAPTLALLALGAAGVGAGCYSTTPHRAQVSTAGLLATCSNAVGDVFERSGFIRVPGPESVSMLYTPRLSGPYTSFLQSGTAVGVTIRQEPIETTSCNITIEALSSDVGCADVHEPVSCGNNGIMNPVTGSFVGGGTPTASTAGPCPLVRPVACQLSYAPGPDNDAAVDELARRVKVALGPTATVN